MSASEAPQTTTAKKRGGPRRINREGIVQAAKQLDPESITMQAVADSLGVDRKALNYHVSSRDGLLQLVAADAFATVFAATAIPEGATWQETVVAFARGTQDGMVATGALATYFRIDPELTTLEPAEKTFDKLVEAGLDGPAALGVLQHVTLVALGMGRDIILERTEGVHPQIPELMAALENVSNEDVDESQFRSLISAPTMAFTEAEFDFEMRLVIGGIVSLLNEVDN